MMTDLSTRLEAAIVAPDKEEQLEKVAIIEGESAFAYALDQLRPEVAKVLISAQKAAKSSRSFAKNLPYSISKKRSKIAQTTLSNLSHSDPKEHEDINSLLTKVKNNTVNFWDANIQQEFTEGQQRYLENSGSFSIILCVALDDKEIHHRILRRFACLVVYELKLAGRTAASLAEALWNVKLYTDRPLVTLIEGYISAGSKYRHLADQLGGTSALFFLPTKVANNFWEAELRKAGEMSDTTIESLKATDISNISESFRQLADNLIKSATDATINIVPRHFTWIQTTEHDEALEQEDTVDPPAKRRKVPSLGVDTFVGSTERGSTSEGNAASITPDPSSSEDITIPHNEGSMSPTMLSNYMLDPVDEVDWTWWWDTVSY